MQGSTGKYSTANARWAGLGPYYAMFPTEFADEVITQFSKPNETVLDPFAGRGTSLFSAAMAGRKSIGVELNPVGWIYAKTKLSPAPKHQVLSRLAGLQSAATEHKKSADRLPLFFRRCFCRNVRAFLTCAREQLDWMNNDVDRTVMAFVLTHLHGKATDSLSNQMRQTKAMSPQYAINWWAERRLKPPKISPAEFLAKKVEWRYARGTPRQSEHIVLLGDSSTVLNDIDPERTTSHTRGASLMLTSPPYFGITNYHYDQWIRLWVLGGPPSDRRCSTQFNGKHQGKFQNAIVYESLLRSVFANASRILRPDAVVYIRTDRREPTLSITRSLAKTCFPNHDMRRQNQPVTGVTQTRLFGHHAPRIGEVDLLLTPR